MTAVGQPSLHYKLELLSGATRRNGFPFAWLIEQANREREIDDLNALKREITAFLVPDSEETKAITACCQKGIDALARGLYERNSFPFHARRRLIRDTYDSIGAEIWARDLPIPVVSYDNPHKKFFTFLLKGNIHSDSFLHSLSAKKRFILLKGALDGIRREDGFSQYGRKAFNLGQVIDYTRFSAEEYISLRSLAPKREELLTDAGIQMNLDWPFFDTFCFSNDGRDREVSLFREAGIEEYHITNVFGREFLLENYPEINTETAPDILRRMERTGAEGKNLGQIVRQTILHLKETAPEIDLLHFLPLFLALETEKARDQAIVASIVRKPNQVINDFSSLYKIAEKMAPLTGEYLTVCQIVFSAFTKTCPPFGAAQKTIQFIQKLPDGAHKERALEAARISLERNLPHLFMIALVTIPLSWETLPEKVLQLIARKLINLLSFAERIKALFQPLIDALSRFHPF